MVCAAAERAVFKAQLEANFNYARYSCPSAKGDGAFYYSYNSGLDPQSTIYRATAEDVKRPTGDAAGPVGEKWFDQNVSEAASCTGGARLLIPRAS